MARASWFEDGAARSPGGRGAGVCGMGQGADSPRTRPEKPKTLSHALESLSAPHAPPALVLLCGLAPNFLNFVIHAHPGPAPGPGGPRTRRDRINATKA